MRLTACKFLVLCLTAAQAAAGEQQRVTPPGTIRVRVRLIPVNVTVTDGHDNPVRDLKQEDFTILENGIQQVIRHFSVQNMQPGEADPGGAMLRKIPSAELIPQSSRTFLILLGRGLHQRAFGSMDSLIRFVREDMLPQDRVAVFAYNRATDFTTDHEQVALVLDRYKGTHEKIESEMDLRSRSWAVLFGKLREVPEPIQEDIDRIFEGPAGSGSRKITPVKVPEVGAIAARNSNPDEAHFSPFDDLEGDAGADLSLDDYAAAQPAMAYWDLQKIFTGIEYLRYMEGEKHLLFFVQKGLSLNWKKQVQLEQDLAAVANDARVAIDTFQTGGIEPQRGLAEIDLSRPYQGEGPRSYPPSRSRLLPPWMLQAWELTSLRRISEYTGGLSVIHRDTGKALDRMNAVTRSQYLLGYYPKDERWDGEYRHIEVRVNRSGVKAYFRHGYFARDSLEPYDRAKFLAYSRISVAAGYPGTDLTDILVAITAAETTTAAGERQIKVDLQIDPCSIGFKTVNRVHTAQLHISFFYADSARRHLGEDWQVLDISLPEDAYQAVTRSGIIPFSAVLPLKVRRQIVKVVVYDAGSDRVGSAQAQLRQ